MGIGLLSKDLEDVAAYMYFLNVCWHCLGILEQEDKCDEYFLVIITNLLFLIKITHNMSSLWPLVLSIVCGGRVPVVVGLGSIKHWLLWKKRKP